MHTCEATKCREELNNRFDDPENLINEGQNANGETVYTVKHEAWRGVTGTFEEVYVYIFFSPVSQSSTTNMKMVRVRQRVEFLDYEEKKSYTPEASFPAKTQCQKVAFGQPLVQLVTIDPPVTQVPNNFFIQHEIGG